MRYHYREREDEKFDVLEGTQDEPGRVVTTLDTEQEAQSYVDELNQADGEEPVMSDTPAASAEAGLNLRSGWRWADMADAAIRLGGWKWSAEEEAYASGAVQQLLGGWKWSDESATEFAKLLGGWKWSHSDDPVESLTVHLLGGWKWANDSEAQQAAIQLLSGWRWGLLGKSGWRWSEEN